MAHIGKLGPAARVEHRCRKANQKGHIKAEVLIILVLSWVGLVRRQGILQKQNMGGSDLDAKVMTVMFQAGVRPLT